MMSLLTTDRPNAARLRRVLVALLPVVVLGACGDDPAGPGDTPLDITTESVASARVGEAYTATVRATGGDGTYQFDVSSGTLPAGLSLSAVGASATISGTPTDAGTSSFTVRVRSGGAQATRAYTLTVDAPPITITTAFVPPALLGAEYGVRIRSDGGQEDRAWSVANGRLPAGLTLSAEGILEGTPTAVDTATVTLRVQSGTSTDDQVLRVIVVPHDEAEYDITPFPVSGVPPAVRAFVDAALAQWQDVLVGDLTPERIPLGFFPEGSCGGFGPLANGVTVDDMLMIINAANVDGRGGVLAFANRCATRDADGDNPLLPVVGFLTLDIADLEGGTLGPDASVDLLAHEIGHALGFGTLWAELGLVDGAGGRDPRFNGPAATAAYAELGGQGTPPLEDTGVGTGTRESHWRQSRFDDELMTGFLSGTHNPLSTLTIASMADLGYGVDHSAAEPYNLGGGPPR